MSGADDGYDVRSLALRFRSGAVLRDHRHPWGQLIFADRGVMTVRTQHHAWMVPPTRAIWIPAGLDHQIHMQSEVAMRTLYIAPRRAENLPVAATALEVAPLLRHLILHVLKLSMLASSIPEQDRLIGVLIDLLKEAPPEDLALPLPRDPRAERMADHLQAHLDDLRNLDALAAEAGASLRTVQRLFVKETGLTLEAWRQKARLIHAVAKLSSGASVTVTALDSGYQSVGAFIVAFRRQFNITPGRYFSVRLDTLAPSSLKKSVS